MGESRGFRPFESLARAARNSPWIMIAAAVHVLVLAGAAIFYTARHEPQRPEPPAVFQFTQSKFVDDLPEPPEMPDRHAIPKDIPSELTAVDIQTVPVDPAIPEDLSQEIGDPLSKSIADDASGGGAIGPGSGSRPGRTSPYRGTGGGLNRPGGRPTDKALVVTEASILEGLRWLARHQNEDGSWSPATLDEVCPCDDAAYHPKKAYGHSFDTGLTSLALLAFLGAGHAHNSQVDLVDPVTRKRHKIGTIVKKGLQWLVARQNPDGSFSEGRPFLYNEALGAMAVCEAYGLSQSRYWREPAQRALDFVQAAQRPSPTGNGLWGWRYAGRQEIVQFHQGAGSEDAQLSADLFDADTSVTGWGVMALKSGQLSGLNVSRESLEGGAAFADFVTQRGADGRPTGLAGYLDAKGSGAKVTGPNDQYVYHPTSMSALAMCIRIFANHDVEDPFLRPAAEQIVKDLPTVSKDGLSIDYYYWYYGSLALNQLDGPQAPKRTGKYWPAWNKAMVDAILPLQSKADRTCATGGWMVPDRWSLDHGGPLYATALNILTLEVYYRYPNAFGGAKRN